MILRKLITPFRIFIYHWIPLSISPPKFFDNLPIPKISEDLVGNLDKPITSSEVREAVMSMQSGKSPDLMDSQ